MTFDALQIARQLIHDLRQPLALVERRDRDLARQLRRAASSVPLNVSEGRQRAGKDQTHLYRVALGSAAEVAEALEVAIGWGYIQRPDAAAALGSIDRVRAMLWRLTRR